jgi:flagellar basal body-associated protein FliL
MSALKSRWKIIVPVLVALLVGVKMFVLKGTEAKGKVNGVVYVLPREFVLNLKDDHFAKLTVALVLPEAPVEGGHGTPPEGFGILEQEAVVRDLVTDEVTGETAKTLTSTKGRKEIKHRLLKAIEEHTDVEASGVLLTDVAVQ